MPCGSFFILLEQTAQIVNYIYRGLWRFFHIKLMWKKVHLVKYSLESWLQSLASEPGAVPAKFVPATLPRRG